MTIADILKSTSPVAADFHAQITELAARETKGGKPFWDITLADGTATLKMKIWSDSPAAADVLGTFVPVVGGPSEWRKLQAGDFVGVHGSFAEEEKFGWGSKDFRLSALHAEQIEALLAGDPARREFLAERWAWVMSLVKSMKDGALRTVTLLLLEKHGDAFRRAAAARGNHHARRGGLVEHVAEMMGIADGICRVLPQLNRSLLLAGVVFHDMGKMKENQYEERGFTMPFDKAATLLGHIVMGGVAAKELWAEAGLPGGDDRLLLLRHLIASHHGELEWGSPVKPMCPEAAVLHYVDQISAKTEMFKAGYLLPEVAPGLHEQSYPMRVNAVAVPGEAEA